MKLKDFQDFCVGMWTGSKNHEYELHDDYVMGLGLSGEAGEVQELLKKAVRDKKDITKVDKKELTKELGDVLYYMMIICDRHGIEPDDVIKTNVKKLQDRYPKR